jgi:hypothetical protein
MGPASTSPQAFHGWTRRLPYFSSYAWWTNLVSGPFDVKPWSGPILKKSFKWHALCWRKSALTECSPWASCYLKQKVGGSWILIVEKTKKTLLRICTLQPPSIFLSSFRLSRTRIEGPLLSSWVASFISKVGGGWRLNWILCNHEVYSVGIFFRICLSLNIVPSRACPLLVAFYLFTETFVRLVLLVLPIYIRRSLAYKYPPGVLLRFIKCLVV